MEVTGLTFRFEGPWGDGKGHPVTLSEYDRNFWNLAQAISEGGGDGAVALAGLTDVDIDSSLAEGDVLTFNGEHWIGQAPSGGGGSGLYSSVLSGTPTSAGTGLTTWLNQGSATVADSDAGICVNAPSANSFNFVGRYKAAPSTPYTVTALVALTTVPAGHAPSAALGWYDGSDKLHTIGLLNNTGSAHWTIEVDKASGPTSFSAADFSTSTQGIVGPQCWLQIEDDGTDVYFRFSNDGANFLEVFSVAKSSGYLGSDGYSNIIFGGSSDNEDGKNCLMSLLSYSD